MPVKADCFTVAIRNCGVTLQDTFDGRVLEKWPSALLILDGEM